MRLATIRDTSPDGRLVVVSPDSAACALAPCPTLQDAIEHWDAVAPIMSAMTTFPRALQAGEILAPLPRAWQWLDGSAFASHGALMELALGIKAEADGRPLMYQGASDRFYAPHEDVPFADEAFGIDFEGEFAVLVDAVPMGTPAEECLAHIKLLLQINDWSLRTLAGPEMRTGFGWVQAKPHCSAAPFAVTPDELGADWCDGRLGLNLIVDWNGRRFGAPNGSAMHFGFHDLVAHAARTRDLVAGTLIGSGTVSNSNYRAIGSTCIAERRGIEIVDDGAPRTDFMRFGDVVRMEARDASGYAPFGAIEQKVIKA
jgi:fumarylacetoacetate (FAA) hydrolase